MIIKLLAVLKKISRGVAIRRIQRRGRSQNKSLSFSFGGNHPVFGPSERLLAQCQKAGIKSARGLKVEGL